MEPKCSLPYLQVPVTCPYPSQIDLVHALTLHFLQIHLTIIFPSKPGSSKWSLKIGLFPSGLPTKTLYTPLLSPIGTTSPAHLILLDLITRIIFGEEYRSLSSSLCIFLFPCYVVPLRSKYFPQHPILKHPQPTFLPQWERPSFTPIQNNRQNYSSLYLKSSHFLIANWKTKNSAPNDSKRSLTSICF